MDGADTIQRELLDDTAEMPAGRLSRRESDYRSGIWDEYDLAFHLRVFD